jgi:hypothetical protein
MTIGTALDVEMREIGAGPNVRIGLGILQKALKMRNHISLVFIFLAGPPSFCRCIAPQLL